MSVRFSQRLEIGRPSAPHDQTIPPKVVTDYFWLLNSLFGSRSYHSILPRVLKVTGSFHKCTVRTGNCNCEGRVRNALRGCSWSEFLDVVEEIGEHLSNMSDSERFDDYSNEVNASFLRNYLAYELRDGLVERVGATHSDKSIAEARAVLRDDELVGPDQQFQKAVAFYGRRPQPDVENCVKEAIGAVEGMARILLSTPSILLHDSAKELGKRKGVHSTLQKLIQNLYAYRGDAEGVAHGKTGAKPAISSADAEFVLNTSAAAIVYLACLYGRDVA